MSNLNERQNLLKELERTEDVLQRLHGNISNVSEFLIPLEHELRSEDFSSTGSFVPGITNGIVCVLSAMIKGDPLATSIELTKGKGRRYPSIIKGSDRSETESTCNSILNIVKGKTGANPINFVINLRWANLPSVIDGENKVVIGKRFYYDKKDSLKKLYTKFKEVGIDYHEDSGEFGGGLLAFKLTHLARKIQTITVLEITLSRHFAEDYERVAEILEAITIL